MAGVFINVPILNEVRNIRELTERIVAVMGSTEYTLLYVDDGSSDGTLEIVEDIRAANSSVVVLHRRKTRRGCQRGGALFDGMKWGLENTPHNIFVEMDGDLSHIPEELPWGISLMMRPDVDFVIGSKYLDHSATYDREFGRQFISRFMNFTVRTMMQREITDYSNGFRFYSREVASAVAARPIRYTSPIYLSEVLAIVLTDGFHIAEFSSTYVGRIEGTSKVVFGDIVEGGLALLDISYRYHTGQFVGNEAHGHQPAAP